MSKTLTCVQTGSPQQRGGPFSESLRLSRPAWRAPSGEAAQPGARVPRGSASFLAELRGQIKSTSPESRGQPPGSLRPRLRLCGLTRRTCSLPKDRTRSASGEEVQGPGAARGVSSKLRKRRRKEGREGGRRTSSLGRNGGPERSRGGGGGSGAGDGEEGRASVWRQARAPPATAVAFAGAGRQHPWAPGAHQAPKSCLRSGFPLVNNFLFLTRQTRIHLKIMKM